MDWGILEYIYDKKENIAHTVWGFSSVMVYTWSKDVTYLMIVLFILYEYLQWANKNDWFWDELLEMCIGFYIGLIVVLIMKVMGFGI